MPWELVACYSETEACEVTIDDVRLQWHAVLIHNRLYILVTLVALRYLVQGKQLVGTFRTDFCNQITW